MPLTAATNILGVVEQVHAQHGRSAQRDQHICAATQIRCADQISAGCILRRAYQGTAHLLQPPIVLRQDRPVGHVRPVVVDEAKCPAGICAFLAVAAVQSPQEDSSKVGANGGKRIAHAVGLAQILKLCLDTTHLAGPAGPAVC